MNRHKRRKMQQAKAVDINSEEVSSTEWEFIKMSEQEEDMIYRMHKLVGDRYLPIIEALLRTTMRWSLIAGRLPGRKPEEIERFWIMRHGEEFAAKRRGKNF